MLRVYLDQSKWIDLSKCRVKKSDGGRFDDVLALSEVAVARSHVSFVLSSAHYYETQLRANGSSRRDLGETMALLSKFHAIAPVQKIVPAEIREYMAGSSVRSQIDLFGIGFQHAFATETDFVGQFRLTNAESLPIAVRSRLEASLRDQIELFILAAPEEAPEAARMMLHTASRINASSQAFADSQETLSRKVVEQKLRGVLNDVAVATEVADIWDPLTFECARTGIDLDDLIAEKDQIHNLIHGLPSRWVMSQLRRVRLRNPQQPWKANDLNDLSFLSIAVPYCDVVVTERQWARHINQLGLAEEFGTTVLHDLTDLTDVIVAASRPDE